MTVSSALGDALEALRQAVAAELPGWNGYVGVHLGVACPAFIIGLPTQVVYQAGPAGRARYDVPITGAVELTRSSMLIPFLSGDGLPAVLQGARSDGWWGDLAVLTGETRGAVPNGTGESLAADVLVQFYA